MPSNGNFLFCWWCLLCGQKSFSFVSKLLMFLFLMLNLFFGLITPMMFMRLNLCWFSFDKKYFDFFAKIRRAFRTFCLIIQLLSFLMVGLLKSHVLIFLLFSFMLEDVCHTSKVCLYICWNLIIKFMIGMFWCKLKVQICWNSGVLGLKNWRA